MVSDLIAAPIKISITDDYHEQYGFIRDEHYASAFIAGLGSGKTHGGALKSLVYCLANPGARGIVTAPTYRVLVELATIPTYLKVFPQELIKEARYAQHPRWKLTNGCEIFFFSTDKPETIIGAEIAFSHMDEGGSSPYLAYKNIRARMRQRRADGTPFPYQLWVSSTPRQLNWMYKEFAQQERADYKIFQASTLENIYMDDVEAYVNRLGYHGKEYEQNILGRFMSLAGDSLFGANFLEARLTDCLDPIEQRENGIIQIWKQPVVGTEYIAGADCADEGGGGVNCMIIMDRQGEEVAEIWGDIAADRFALLCNNLGREYNDALFAPERNSFAGGVVTTKLQELHYPKLYRDDKGHIGWYTFPKATPPKVGRPQMLGEYEEAVRLRQTIIRSSDAIGEMSTFVRGEGDTDKYKHMAECRDDRVMARAICWQMRKHRQNTGFVLRSVKRLACTY